MSTETTPDDWCRNHGIVAGSDFHDAIWLAGFERQSVWGYDEGTCGFFAQVWANTSRGDNPDLWLTAPNWRLPHAHTLVAPIVDHTAADPLDVVRALGIAHPAPTVRPPAEIFDKCVELVDLGDASMADGARTTADWLLGHSEHAPLSRTRSLDLDDPTPDAADVDAESTYASSVVYLTQSPWAVAAETLLVFATH